MQNTQPFSPATVEHVDPLTTKRGAAYRLAFRLDDGRTASAIVDRRLELWVQTLRGVGVDLLPEDGDSTLLDYERGTQTW